MSNGFIDIGSSTPNVCDDLEVGGLGMEEFDLVGEVVLLLARGDTSIDDGLSRA